MADEEGEAPAEGEAEENAVEGEIALPIEDEAIEEENVDETEEDPFELLNEDSEDNEEEHNMYREYLNLTKEIDCQNALINDMKDRLRELCAKACQTRKERDEAKHLRICLDKENIKLNTMINRAIQLQNNGSRRLYGSIELATSTYEEALFPDTSQSTKAIKRTPLDSCPRTAKQICDALEDSDSDCDDHC